MAVLMADRAPDSDDGVMVLPDACSAVVADSVSTSVALTSATSRPETVVGDC